MWICYINGTFIWSLSNYLSIINFNEEVSYLQPLSVFKDVYNSYFVVRCNGPISCVCHKKNTSLFNKIIIYQSIKCRPPCLYYKNNTTVKLYYNRSIIYIQYTYIVGKYKIYLYEL